MHEERKIYTCEICAATFARENSFELHIATVHEGKKPFRCDICNEEFVSKHRLDGHTATVHYGKKPFECKDCGDGFLSKQRLKTHIGKQSQSIGSKLLPLDGTRLQFSTSVVPSLTLFHIGVDEIYPP